MSGLVFLLINQLLRAGFRAGGDGYQKLCHIINRQYLFGEALPYNSGDDDLGIEYDNRLILWLTLGNSVQSGESQTRLFRIAMSIS